MRNMLLAFILAWGLAGCSKFAANTEEESFLALQVMQDKNAALLLDVTGTNTGLAVYTYTAVGVPAWASFDPTTGILSGIPTSYADGFNVHVSRSKDGAPATEIGPYRVNVYGNPLKDQQWHLKNTGQTSYARLGGTAGEDLHMGTVIADGIDGTGVKIAISDTGVVIAHEGLQANALAAESRNYFNDFGTSGTWLGDPTPDQTDPGNAHGTAVASLAAQAGWNGLGGRGVAPGASIAGFLYLPAQEQLSLGLYATVALNDQFTGTFDIFNYSWGDSQCQFANHSLSTLNRLQAGATTQRAGLGSLFVISSGNSYMDSLGDCVFGVTTNYYGNAASSDLTTTPYTFVISALNADGVASSYSTPGANLTVTAPGGEYGYSKNVSNLSKYSEPAMIAADFSGCRVGIKTLSYGYSAFNSGKSPNKACNYTSTMNGTSSAAPVASGAMALILQTNPALTWRDVKHILASTSDKVDPTVNPVSHPDPAYNLTGHSYEQGWVTNAAGFHFMNYYGFGRINVASAVAMARLYAVNLGVFSTSNWVDTSGAVVVAIPDVTASGATQTLVSATALTLEAVQLKLSLSGCIGDVGIELTSPSGTKSILYNTNSLLQDVALVNQIFLSNAFYGELSTGTWTLKLIDAHAGCTANLTNWSLNFAGH